MGNISGSAEFFLKLLKWEGDKAHLINLAWCPRWLNPAQILSAIRSEYFNSQHANQ